MLKPDAVEQRLTGPVLDWLSCRGFTPRRYRELGLTPQLRSQLYETTRTVGLLDWELNAVLYTLAPVRAVLLTHEDHATRLSGSLKGSFLPPLARPGTLRHDIGALNPICNLVHSSDDDSRVRREAEILFGAPSLDVDPPSIAALDAARAEIPQHTPLWPTVRAVVTTLVGDWDGLPWPADGAGSTRQAIRTAANTLTELAATVTGPTAALLSGARTGATCYGDWEDRAARMRRWHTYLAYTTVRYLDLCLQHADDA